MPQDNSKGTSQAPPPIRTLSGLGSVQPKLSLADIIEAHGFALRNARALAAITRARKEIDVLQERIATAPVATAPEQASTVESLPPKRERRDHKPRILDQQLAETRLLVKPMKAEGATHEQMCKRLADHPRPQDARWKDLTWPMAYRKHNSSVKKWLSKASR